MDDDSRNLGKLREILPEEVELMRLWRNSPSVRINMYTHHEISVSEHFFWWENVKLCKDKKYLMYEFQDRPLGVVYLNAIDFINKNAAWGFYSSPEAPRGTGSKMEYLVLEYFFYEVKFHKLYCEVLAFNTPVINLHKKFGFKLEGVKREEKIFNEEYIDVYNFGILDKEWGQIRSNMYQRLRKIVIK